MKVAILNFVVREGPTEKEIFVQRVEGDRGGSNHCGYLLKEHSRQKKKQNLRQHSRQKKMQMQKPETNKNMVSSRRNEETEGLVQME